MDPYIGQMLDGRYEILERIGSGGMAVVYKAKCHRLDRLVAVKILRSDLAQDEGLRRRFSAESQAVARLSSPNIVSVYDVSQGGDLEYLVMELIDGITLKQYMEKRGRLDWRESLHFIIQVMRGLAHAHSRGIVHRDIKPQNIMVLRDGSVRVADFGIACLENAHQTLTQQALGSVHYISPEQARGERVDCRSDIYSAGVVLYEMLTGRLPFEGESAVSVALQHLSSIPLDPRSIDPSIPAPLELICLKAMAPDRERRYASAGDMIRDLEAFREDPEVVLDLRLEDLRPDAVDEPTRKMGGSIPAGDASPDATGPLDRRERLIRAGLVSAGGLAAAVAVVLLFRAAVGAVFAREAPQEQYVVKNVVGYTVEQARGLDGVRDIFEIREEGEEPSEDWPRGTIVRQDPAPDRTRKGGNLVIRVWVSSGEEVARMPRLTGQTVSQAEKTTLSALIQKYGLTIQADEEDMRFEDDVPMGHIISSIPAEGEEVQKGDTIRLILSKGVAMWELVPFVGMDYFSGVRRQMTGMGLVPGEVRYEFGPEPFGTIVRQDPEPLTLVRDGTVVDLVVSRGPDPSAASVETVSAGEGPEGPERASMTVVQQADPPDPGPETEVWTESDDGTDLPYQEGDDGDTVMLEIPLPQGRASGYLEVYQDGERLRQGEVVDCGPGTCTLPISGHGEVRVEVYLDGTEIYSGTVLIGEDDPGS